MAIPRPCLMHTQMQQLWHLLADRSVVPCWWTFSQPRVMRPECQQTFSIKVQLRMLLKSVYRALASTVITSRLRVVLMDLVHRPPHFRATDKAVIGLMHRQGKHNG